MVLYGDRDHVHNCLKEEALDDLARFVAACLYKPNELRGLTIVCISHRKVEGLVQAFEIAILGFSAAERPMSQFKKCCQYPLKVSSKVYFLQL